jgi:hypothetical protein
MPLALAAAFSKATWIHGTFHAENGKIEVATSRHPVAEVAIVGPLEAFSTILTIIDSSQPAHSL